MIDSQNARRQEMERSQRHRMGRPLMLTLLTALSLAPPCHAYRDKPLIPLFLRCRMIARGTGPPPTEPPVAPKLLSRQLWLHGCHHQRTSPIFIPGLASIRRMS